MNIKFILFLIGLIALLAFQAKIVMPVVKDIASSDFFMDDSGDEQNRLSVTSLMTNAAHSQCNTYISNELLPDHALSFSKQPLNLFSLGNFQYLVNADLEITPENTASFTRRYACRIKYDEGDDKSGLSDPENWSISGISGLDNL
ncbi:MAG: hypothetical protein KAT04_12615 [Methylococcales bacterium]|nr:hypothetical protein [Methylococcales bacterium]